MLAPGSGLGGAYVDASGLPLDGDTLAGMEAGHLAAPLHLLGVDALTCGCGRDCGCYCDCSYTRGRESDREGKRKHGRKRERERQRRV